MNTKKQVHVSWQVALAAAGVLVGSVLALLPQGVTFANWVCLMTGLLLVGGAFWKRTKQMLLIALAGGLLIGAWRGANEQLHLAKYGSFYGRTTTIQGRVMEDTKHTSGGQQHIRITDIQVADAPLHGDIWVSSSSRQTIERGDILKLRGQLSEGFGTFAASLHRAEILSVYQPRPGDIGRQVRDWFAWQVRKTIPEPQASLGISYTFGQSQGLSETVSHQFQLLGLTHLLIASGSQLTLLVRFVRRPLSKSSKYLAMAASLILIGSYLLLTGLSPSMVRAGLVSALSLTAWYYGRAIHPAVLLLLVAGSTVLMQPSFIWGDVGWLLSFAAFGGIIILAPLLHHYFWGGEREAGFLRYLLVSTVAAQIVTLPVAVYAFGEYSPLAVIANMVILPLASIVMLLTFLSGVATAALPVLGTIVSWPAQVALSYIISVTERLAASPWAHGEASISAPMLYGSYLIIVTVIAFLWLQTRHNFQQPYDSL